MDRKVLKILLAAMLLMTILPPMTAMSYDVSGGITKAVPVVRYGLLFTKSPMVIDFHRLFLQYLIVLIAGAGLVLSQRKVKSSLAVRVGELTLANDKLLQHVANAKYSEQQLKLRINALTVAKEEFSRRINEQLQREITERRQLEKSLGQQIADLAAANEKTQDQTNKYKILEEQFSKHRQQYDNLLKEHSALLDRYNERLQEKTDGAAQSEERFEQSQMPSVLFDVKEMKSLAELAKRLSKR